MEIRNTDIPLECHICTVEGREVCECKDTIECRACGETVNTSDTFQGRCDACEDKQMVQGIR